VTISQNPKLFLHESLRRRLQLYGIFRTKPRGFYLIDLSFAGPPLDCDCPGQLRAPDLVIN